MRISKLPLLGAALAVTLFSAPSQAVGQDLAAQYSARLDALRAELGRDLPKVSSRKQGAYLEAQEGVKAAEAELKKAQDALGQVGTARALVGHAKGKWIGGADRGIAKAKDMLAKASSDAERQAAQAELEKWQQNRRDGEQALKERQAALDKALREEPRLKKAVERAQAGLDRAHDKVERAIKGLRLESMLSSDALDAKLAEFVLLLEAKPANLAGFAGQGRAQRQLVDDLLADPELMLQMVVADGAKEGRYGEAMQVYRAIQASSPKASEGVLQRLALAIALEHAVPIKQRNPDADSQGPSHVDPVARYQHYETAYEQQELDPAFGQLSIWDYRMVVDGDEPDATLAWGREMLRSYRPDHIYASDYRWRYVASVRTDIRYGSQDNKHDKPELQFFQNILMNGGVCGRRAFFGRFMLRAFGVPTTARPQRGHAALAHWTPDGWVVCLGGGWGAGWTKTRYRSDLDFLATTQARADREAYLQVKRAQWIGDVVGEPRIFGLREKAAQFWYGVALQRQQEIIEENGAVTLAAVGEELGEANESKVRYATEAAQLTEADREIRVYRPTGVITIPAVACSSPTKSTGKILFLPSNLGGKQLHYARNGGGQPFEYTFEAPKAGRYRLSARVVTPSWQQHLMITANGNGEPVDLALPHTVGTWDTTDSVEVELVAGTNVLRFEHRSDGQAKGFSVKDFVLSPIKER